MSDSKGFLRAARIVALASVGIMLIAGANGAFAKDGHQNHQNGVHQSSERHDHDGRKAEKVRKERRADNKRRSKKIGGLFCKKGTTGCLVHVSGPKPPVQKPYDPRVTTPRLN